MSTSALAEQSQLIQNLPPDLLAVIKPELSWQSGPGATPFYALNQKGVSLAAAYWGQMPTKTAMVKLLEGG
ncbi:MAG: hypothetical protein ACRCTY_09260, partial [Candidatus Adiutrix sp.]